MSHRIVKLRSILLAIVVIKLLLDCLSPFREVNFLILNLSCIMLFLLRPDFLPLISIKDKVVSTFCLALFSLWALTGEDPLYFMKFSSIIIIFLTIKVITIKISIEDTNYLLKKIPLYSLIIIGLNLVISFIIKNPLSREFYNFEHANLIGSYILLISPFIFLTIRQRGNWIIQSILTSTLALISTSTGAFLASLLLYLRINRLTIYNLLSLSLILILIAFVFFFITESFFPTLHTKVFGPILLIINGGGGELIALSKYRLPIQELGSEYQSSLVWRFYAYSIFIDFFTSQTIIHQLFGSGFWGFSNAWSGIAPHNDFLLALIDFGLLGLLIVCIGFYKLINFSIKNEPLLLPIIAILILRLMFENNIYSFYILSGLTINATFLYYSLKKFRAHK